MPISRSFATDCCVGLVFNSPAALMNGTNVTCIKHDVAVTGFERELADGFEERQAFDVAGGAADFGDDDVRLRLLSQQMNAVLDFVGDVWNHLNGLAEVFPFALVVEHGLIDLAAGEVVEARELDVGEALVMAEVEVGLRAVVEHIDLAVLVGLIVPGSTLR